MTRKLFSHSFREQQHFLKIGRHVKQTVSHLCAPQADNWSSICGLLNLMKKKKISLCRSIFLSLASPWPLAQSVVCSFRLCIEQLISRCHDCCHAPMTFVVQRFGHDYHHRLLETKHGPCVHLGFTELSIQFLIPLVQPVHL